LRGVLLSDYLRLYGNCRLCPRECGVDRLSGKLGYCREAGDVRVGYIGPHFGEEPPLTGESGSGTVFFTGCSLRCSFCQNHQISHDGIGRRIELQALFDRVVQMIRGNGVHNVNLVTPDHFFPHVFRLTELLKESGDTLPVLYNLSGYQSSEMIRLAEPLADIYLPDFKYSDRDLSARLSGCPDYPDRALDAISEMIRQKGFLEPTQGKVTARKGVLLRHMILPGCVRNSLDALTTLFLEFGPGLPLSLMSQYTPVRAHRMDELNRVLTKEEFDAVYGHALELGFERLFVQFPEERSGPLCRPFLPDFRKESPFAGNPREERRKAESGKRKSCD
jgi:putative pyruvate formate lyase activating enzyme